MKDKLAKAIISNFCPHSVSHCNLTMESEQLNGLVQKAEEICIRLGLSPEEFAMLGKAYLLKRLKMDSKEMQEFKNYMDLYTR